MPREIHTREVPCFDVRCARLWRQSAAPAAPEPNIDFRDLLLVSAKELPGSLRSQAAKLVTLCYTKVGRAVARAVARNSERTVHSERSGTRALLSVQVARQERHGGLLVMRRSGVRFPKAAQVET